MIGDAMALHERDEVGLRVAAQGRDGEAWILREVVRRGGMEIGEVAAPAARNTNLFRQFLCMIQQQNLAPLLASDSCTHHTGSPCPQHNDIK